MARTRDETDRGYLERTADRLRAMSAAQVDLSDADANEVRARLERMTYGGSRQRNQRSAWSDGNGESPE